MNRPKGWRGVAVLWLAAQVTGCGSVLDALPGSGGSEGSGSSTSSLSPPLPIGTLEGVAKDALIQSGTVRVYAWDGSKGELLGSGMTDDRGRYSFELQVGSQSVLLEVTGGRYTEEATGQVIQLAERDALFAVQNYRRGQTLNTSITYYTTLATGLAENLVRLGMNPPDAVQEANNRLSAILGIDTTTVMPADIVRPEDLTPAALEYGFATAAISSLTERASIMNGSEPHRFFTSIRFIQSAYDDVRADGVLNGRGLNGEVAFGRIRLTAEIYRRELALHILRIANNERANNTGLRPMELFDLAGRLNVSTDPIFGGAPIIAIDRDQPNVTALTAREFSNLGNGSVVFGGLNLSAMVVTFPGAASAELILDDERVIGTAADPSNPEILLDTINFPIDDGPHTLKLRVTDISGAVGESPTLEVTVSNRQTAIENIDIEGTFVGNSVLVTANIVDPAGPVRVAYSVRAGNGAFMSLPAPQIRPNGTLFEASAPFDPCLMRDRNGCQQQLPNGAATFRVEVTNSAGITFAREVPFTIDLVPPTVRIVTPIELDNSNFNDQQGRYFDRVRNTPCSPAELGDDLCLLYVRKPFVINTVANDDRALDSVTLTVDGANVMQSVMPDSATTSANIPFTIDSSSFRAPQANAAAQPDPREGQKAVTVIARDKAQNTVMDSRRIVFDTTPPEGSLTVVPVSGQGEAKVLNGRMTVRGIVNIAAEVQDPNGLAAASLFLDLTPLSSLTTQGVLELRNQGTEAVRLSAPEFDTRSLVPDAAHTFSVVAADRAGNRIAPGAPLAVDFDNTGPTVSVDTIFKTEGGQGACVVRGKVTDPSGATSLQQSANVTFRDLFDREFQPQDDDPFFVVTNGTVGTEVPVNIVDRVGPTGGFDATVTLDGNEALREFRIELLLTARDELGNSAMTSINFTAVDEGGTLTCSQPEVAP